MKIDHRKEIQPAVDEGRKQQLMDEIMEEIATLESRLEDMGMDGDCAYEHAMSRVYIGMVEERKRQLAELRGLPHC